MYKKKEIVHASEKLQAWQAIQGGQMPRMIWGGRKEIASLDTLPIQPTANREKVGKNKA